VSSWDLRQGRLDLLLGTRMQRVNGVGVVARSKILNLVSRCFTYTTLTTTHTYLDVNFGLIFIFFFFYKFANNTMTQMETASQIL
jgi:hypothetical protein